jgi:hypothetical protein
VVKSNSKGIAGVTECDFGIDAMSTGDSGIAGLHADGLSELVTMEMLNEELSVVEHSLATTPTTPFTTSQRYKLSDERERLLRMIQQKILEGEGDPNNGESNNSSSPTTSLSPTLSAQPDPSNTNSASISGFSTPDLFAGRDHNPFALAFEQPFLPDTNRMAQELAYTPVHT